MHSGMSAVQIAITIIRQTAREGMVPTMQTKPVFRSRRQINTASTLWIQRMTMDMRYIITDCFFISLKAQHP